MYTALAISSNIFCSSYKLTLPISTIYVCGQEEFYHYLHTWTQTNCVSVWNKKPTRCHLVLYLFLLYKLLNMFRATLCPSSGADDLVVFFMCGVVPRLCRQSDPVGWLCVHWEVRATYFPMDTQPANRI